MASENTTLSNREILKLVEGFKALDGVSNEAGKIERYELSQSGVWNVSKDRHLLENAVEPYQKAKSALAAQLGIVENMKLTPENAPMVAKFIAGEQALLDEKQKISGLLKLSRADLWKAGVRIPGIYVSLMPLLND